MNKTLKCKAVQYYGIPKLKLLKLLAPVKCSGGVLDLHSLSIHLHLKTFFFLRP